MVVSSQLVDFVQDEQRVACARFFEILEHPPGHGADVSLAVATDFGFVVQPTQTHADVFPSEGFRDASPQGGLAHAWRAVQAKDGGLHVALDFEHRQVFNDALLYFFQPVVVLVQHRLGVGQIEVVIGDFIPRKLEHHVQIVGLHAVLTALRVHPFQLSKLFVKGFAGVVGPVFVRRFGALLLNFFLQRVGSQLILDGLHLLVEEEFALLLVKVGLDFGVDVLLQGEHVLLLVEQLHHRLGAFAQIHFFQNALLLVHLHLHVAANEIDQKPQPVDALDGLCRLRGDVGVHFNELGGQIAQALHHGLAFLFGQGLFDSPVGGDIRFEVGFFLDDVVPRETLLSLKDHSVGAVGHLQHFHDAGDGANAI